MSDRPASRARLSDRAENVYSQFGEDGIISAAFERLGEGKRRCIEFGAWDGFYLSNTANLWTRGWTGVLIEADEERHRELVRNTAGHDCVCLHEFVGVEPGGTLEDLLAKNDLPLEADLLSIDTDRDDYYIFASLEKLRPRLICCEYNPTFPPHLDLRPRPGARFGCSPLSLLRLAEAKGYRLIAATEGNLLFVRQEDFSRFDDLETSWPALADDRHLTYLINGFDGSYLFSSRPTYGYREPSRHPFVGPCFHPVSPRPARPTGLRRLVRKVRRTLSGGGLRRGQGPTGIDPRVLAAWRRDRGDETLRQQYPLDADSIVFDAGGFRGQWASDIHSRYGCRVEVFEPVPEYAAAIERRFAANPKITVHPFGLAGTGGKVAFHLDGDASSALRATSGERQVEMKGIVEVLAEMGREQIDLLKVNIEGGEYELLTALLDSGLIRRVRDLQVQFHPFVAAAGAKRQKLQARLEATHSLTYEYPFVWESWHRDGDGEMPGAAAG